MEWCIGTSPCGGVEKCWCGGVRLCDVMQCANVATGMGAGMGTGAGTGMGTMYGMLVGDAQD